MTFEAEKKRNRERRRRSYRKNRERELERMRVIRGDVALGLALRAWRTERGLTQRELGARMGTTQSAVSRLERGLDPMTERWRELIR